MDTLVKQPKQRLTTVQIRRFLNSTFPTPFVPHFVSHFVSGKKGSKRHLDEAQDELRDKGLQKPPGVRSPFTFLSGFRLIGNPFGFRYKYRHLAIREVFFFNAEPAAQGGAGYVPNRRHKPTSSLNLFNPALRQAPKRHDRGRASGNAVSKPFLLLILILLLLLLLILLLVPGQSRSKGKIKVMKQAALLSL